MFQRLMCLALACSVASCGFIPVRSPEVAAQSQGTRDDIGLYPGETREMRALVQKYAACHGIPESLLHRVIQRESDYRAGARNGPYWGLMQILPQTARTMGHRGTPESLLNAETNLLYAGRYLRGAWLLSNGDEATAVSWYARGYYYEARDRGLLVETGLRPGGERSCAAEAQLL
ncbi:MAG: transglycosylase SLT domain-containing protein [Yoonia sp.]|uniref:transglycosylase SLT domain-containing protein n=1 Tax=Yoonia sp. TaxID=2212373 RepID=UPI003263B205